MYFKGVSVLLLQFKTKVQEWNYGLQYKVYVLKALQRDKRCDYM